MKNIIGFGMFFIAVGILLSYFLTGLIEFTLITIFLLSAYLLLCKC